MLPYCACTLNRLTIPSFGNVLGFDHKKGVTKRISKEGATAWSGLIALFGEGCADAPFPWSPRLLSALLHNDNNRVTSV